MHCRGTDGCSHPTVNSDPIGMLHITNGDTAVATLRRAGIPGDMLPWNDVLHEGPVPAGLDLEALSARRSRFISEQGWGPPDEVARSFAERDAMLADSDGRDEVVLWFEHDLFDQLQLIQLLDWFAQRPSRRARLSMVSTSTYLGKLAPDRADELFASRQTVTQGQLALGQSAWAAYRSPDPLAIQQLMQLDTSSLPWLHGALERHLEEFPSVGHGLSRSERQAVETVAAGPRSLRDAFVSSHHEREERIFLGDWVFAQYLERLSGSRAPLLRREDGGAIAAREAPQQGDQFWEGRIAITDAGRDVLAGRRDWIAMNGIDRWLGGVHLDGDRAQWRWDAGRHSLVAGH